MPKVSIVVPIYNVEKYLGACLDSLTNQTLKDIEIICVDDCGTDNSVDIVKQYMQKDNWIHLIHHEQNQRLCPVCFCPVRINIFYMKNISILLK